MITYKIYCITNMQTHEHYIGVTSQENLNWEYVDEKEGWI